MASKNPVDLTYISALCFLLSEKSWVIIALVWTWWVYIMILLNHYSVVCICFVLSINIYRQGMCLNNFLLRTCFIFMREQSSLVESSKGKRVSHRRQRNIQYFWQEQKTKKKKKKNQWRYIGDISDMNVNTVFQFGDNSCVNILYWNLFWLRVLEKREGEREWQRERKCLCVAKNERERVFKIL